jgi:predicted RNase H-like HicB family nuclease
MVAGDGLYIVSCPELPNVWTHGTTHQDAVEMGAEVIATYLFALRGHDRPVPLPASSALATTWTSRVSGPPRLFRQAHPAINGRAEATKPHEWG